MKESVPNEPTAREQLWSITKPSDPVQALEYQSALYKTLSTPTSRWYKDSFEVPKPTGGARTITPAAEPLRTTQFYLARWIQENLPQGKDYCYTGRQVNAALAVHRNSSYALVCDLKSAFDQVTEEDIKKWFNTYDSRLSGRHLNILAKLMTRNGRTPQGCSTTPFAYNVVVNQLDERLEEISQTLGAEKYTRYSDNMCFSSSSKFNQEELKENVINIIHDFGFDLSWAKNNAGSIEYLGATINDGKVFIADDRVSPRIYRVYNWLGAEQPEKYYLNALGILVWARGLAGPNVNTQLLLTLDKYFRSIGKPSQVEKTMGKAYGRLL